jgi:hypothetical protein
MKEAKEMLRNLTENDPKTYAIIGAAMRSLEHRRFVLTKSA